MRNWKMCSYASDYQNMQRYKHFVKKIQNEEIKTNWRQQSSITGLILSEG